METNSLTASGHPDEINGADTHPTTDCSFQSTEDAAHAYASAGLSVIPVKQDKTPAVSTWKEFKSNRASAETIRQWYASGDPGVAIVCGAVSGNLECLDIDEKYNLDPTPLLDQFSPLVDAQAPGLLVRLVHETSVNGGHHFVYRCKTVEGNTKLARRPTTAKEKEDSILKKKAVLRSEGKSDSEIDKMNVDPLLSMTLLETRGEGGYFACYPTPGYKLISGSFLHIPEITEEERKILFTCARSLNKYSEDQKKETAYPKKRLKSVVRPGDDFNERGDISPVLKDAGWKLVFTTKDKVQHWRRPQKKDGTSATFNKHDNMFYVFSSNCAPLEPEKWYTKFSLLALLSYGGSFIDAAKDLAEQGYGATIVAEAETFLNQFFEFRFNVVTGRVEYEEKGGTEFAVVQDYDLNSICRKLNLSHIPIGADALARLLKSEYAKPFDPFKEYYESLPPWDQSTDYIAQLADTVQLKRPQERATWNEYLKKWLVAAVGCAIDPKINNQTCLTLVGPQGYYKSTWLNRLVPERLSGYLHVGTIDPMNKDTMIHLSECFMINLDELETLNKHELGGLKSIMTMSENRIRRPYAHFADQLIRRASFVGSINKDSFLADETGSRRFLVFEVDTISANHGIDMDKIHAQAYHLFKSGFRYWFDRDETATVNERNKEFSIQTTEDELVAKYCFAGSEGEWKTATDVAQRMSTEYSYPLKTSSARDFGYALRKAEFPSKKVSGIAYYSVAVDRPFLNHPTSGGVKGGVGGGVTEGRSVESDLF
jgi:hypothetical protein